MGRGHRLITCHYNKPVTEEKVLVNTEHKKTLHSSQSETHSLTQCVFNLPQSQSLKCGFREADGRVNCSLFGKESCRCTKL